jgi:hypothetical protein
MESLFVTEIDTFNDSEIHSTLIESDANLCQMVYVWGVPRQV